MGSQHGSPKPSGKGSKKTASAAGSSRSSSSNRHEIHEDGETSMKQLRGEDKEDSLRLDIIAAIEAESENIQVDFDSDNLTQF